MTTFDELFAEHNLTPKERKALVMHLATLRAQKTVEALQDGPPASAPSTPPPAVVEAVPQTWPIERAADMLTAYAELVKATGRYAEEHYIPEIENVAAELCGIAPKAAQPQEKREPWLCLLCKSDRPGHHGLLDDRVTPCPDGAPKAAQQWANVPFKPETWQPDADGFTPDLCTECGTPVRYGSRHSKCAPKAAQEPRDA